ncbi:ead/Ea22-like family protein [Citrobacter freundii]|uniref:ead/Ea22-like family protein n=1 Tax=Citrobacter freundii TaxID=546 RepID=UPI0023B255D0|nr:ead/Ea22-like family protein [Citrobacter freundii]MDE9603712.1 ead/Ea22-like family protein [Citrobacter freundii]
MTALNKQALREAAEKATPGEWKRMMRNSDELMTTFHGVAIGNVFVELTTGKRDIFDAEFIAAANPATVLALLDELEAAENRISELEAVAVVVKQFDDFQIVHYGGSEDYAKGYIDCQNNYNKAIADAGIGVKGE